MPIFDTVVCAPFEQGQKKKGVGDGARELSSLLQSLRQSTHLLVTPTNSDERKNWGDDYKRLYDVLGELDSYVLLGGDHSIGQSSVASSLTKVNSPSDLVVIWIDAHADTNTYESSLSKNYHGMPLAGIVGYEKPWFDFDLTLPMKNLLYFGIRDLDTFERDQINKNNVFYTSNLQVLKEEINKILTNNPNTKFHISWDVDSLDPTIFDSTGCLANDGLSVSNVIEVIDYLKTRTIALDIVEYNPLLGDNEKSLDVLRAVFEHLT